MGENIIDLSRRNKNKKIIGIEPLINGQYFLADYCLKHNIKLIYSATSASLGNKGKDKNLSPYAFTKAKNLELLENLRKWFNFNQLLKKLFLKVFIFCFQIHGIKKNIKKGDC